MIRQSFISVVGILHSQNDVLTLPAWLSSVYQSLQANFSDYEIVLINSQPTDSLDFFGGANASLLDTILKGFTMAPNIKNVSHVLYELFSI